MGLRFGRRVLVVIVSMAVAGLLLAHISSGAPAVAYAQTAAACPGRHRDVSLPLTDLGSANYRRMDGQTTEFTGGLYPDGSNVRPPVHEAAGQALAAHIVPRWSGWRGRLGQRPHRPDLPRHVQHPVRVPESDGPDASQP